MGYEVRMKEKEILDMFNWSRLDGDYSMYGNLMYSKVLGVDDDKRVTVEYELALSRQEGLIEILYNKSVLNHRTMNVEDVFIKIGLVREGDEYIVDINNSSENIKDVGIARAWLGDAEKIVKDYPVVPMFFANGRVNRLSSSIKHNSR